MELKTGRGAVDYKWKVLATVLFGVFMVILDTTVVNVSFQKLRLEFGRDLADTQWILSVYVLALGISTPLAGFLGDRFGIKRMYLGALGLFIGGSLLCGLAPSLEFLIVARAIQGIGGGISLPLGVALLFGAFPPREQGTALGIFGIAALVAPAIGPIIGGILVDADLWRVIFFLNPPIGAIGLILGSRFLIERRSERKLSFDWLGMVTEVIGFGSILYAASIAAGRGWNSPEVTGWFVLGAAGLVAFFLVELFVAPQPLLDVRLYRKRVFLNASLLGYVSTVALFGAEFLMPVYLQSLRGRTALETGMILLPMAITGGLFVTISGRLYDRVGPRPLMVAGFSILLINTWQLSQIRADSPVSWILVLLALRGIALGLTVQTTMVTAMSVVPRDDYARGSSLNNATRLVVQSIGVAVLATVLASTVSPEIRELQSRNPAQAGGEQTAVTAICEPPRVALLPVAFPPGGTAVQGEIPSNPGALLQRACDESVAGFERAYRLTFYLSFVAIALGAMLPGWPAPWVGRTAVGNSEH